MRSKETTKQTYHNQSQVNIAIVKHPTNIKGMVPPLRSLTMPILCLVTLVQLVIVPLGTLVHEY